ncbi:MAG: hypothetical protein ACRDHZ_00300 [Ktedonobacteraceae bacterium]
MFNININVAQILLVLGFIGILIAVLFFEGTETAYKRLLQLLEAVVKALSTLFKLLNK